MEKRLEKVEGQVQNLDQKFYTWVERQDDKRKDFENGIYQRLDKVVEEMRKYIQNNSVSATEIKTMREVIATLQNTTKYHEKSINTFEVYLKNILDELHNVNLGVMKQDINNVHQKLREHDQIISNHQSDFFEFKKEVRKDIQEIKSTVGKYAIKAWIWLISIVATGFITWLITHLITNGGA